MQTTRLTGRIRITKVPNGEAPLRIRQAWVGLILPCDPYLGYPDNGCEQGVLSKKTNSRNRCGFSVPQDQAIAILKQKEPDIAKWWKRHGFPKANQCFGFAEEEAEILNGVTRQKIIHVSEEMMGAPSR